MKDAKQREKAIDVGMQFREASVDSSTLTRADASEEQSREFEISFSSEYPVERWFGREILDHEEGSIRLDRINNSGPLLLDHDAREHHGTVVRAWLDKSERKLRARVRLGQGPKRDEILSDVLDGIRKTVSVGYRIHKAIPEEISDDEIESFRVVDWEPFEVTLTAVPADPGVGIGRNGGEDTNPLFIQRKEVPKMKDDKTGAAPENKDVDPVRVIDASGEQIGDAVTAERKRVSKIQAVGEKTGQRELAGKAIAEGWTLDRFSEAVLDNMPGAKQVRIEDHTAEEIGLSEKEKRSYSFLRMIRAQVMGPQNPKFIEEAAFEAEVSRATAKKFGQEATGWLVAPDVLLYEDERIARALQHRALTAGVAGASTIETTVLGGSFIEILRKMTVLDKAGITILDGLQGDIAIPRQTGAGTHYWLANDTTDITESTQTLDQVAMTPKNIGAYSVYTRQLLLQSSIAVEAWLRSDLARVVAIGLDAAGLYGSGSAGQPRGVANTSGINAPTNFAAAVPTFAEVVAMETAVDLDSALMGSLAYITDPTIRGGLKTTVKFSGGDREIWQPGNELNGYPGLASAQVTAGDMFFGNWADLILGLWGGLDVMSNPYTLDQRRNVKVSVLQSADYGVRHPDSFAFNNDGA